MYNVMSIEFYPRCKSMFSLNEMSQEKLYNDLYVNFLSIQSLCYFNINVENVPPTITCSSPTTKFLYVLAPKDAQNSDWSQVYCWL